MVSSVRLLDVALTGFWVLWQGSLPDVLNLRPGAIIPMRRWSDVQIVQPVVGAWVKALCLIEGHEP